MNEINVSIRPYSGLFEKKRRIVIPEYQRPYVWGKEKTEELLNDFEDYFLNLNSIRPYYLGTILYYYNKNENHYEVIDGQQRITTLLIIQKLLSESHLPEYQDVVYNSHQSRKYIQEAKAYFKQNIEVLKKLEKNNFFEKLNFTLIKTYTEDDAFTFFDTQNNRGIKLGATDFLKAYHLRAISSEFLQEQCARKWEKSSCKIDEGSLLSHLFAKILWRGRNWKGQNEINFENKDSILKTFQKSTLKTTIPDFYPLYPNFFNMKCVSHQFQSMGKLIEVQKELTNRKEADYPFSLRQPLYKGLNFFRYSDRYIAIYNLLFLLKNDSSIELIELRKFYDTVYNVDMSIYLRHFMQLCLIAYFDVFGDNQILKAAYSFDYLIGSIRLSKFQIKKEAITICSKESPNNVLDIISNSYLPEEIIGFICSNISIDDIYLAEKIKRNDGVRGRYKTRVLKYFNKSEKSLANRKIWGKL